MNGAKTIHVIEENPSIADVLRIVLEGMGYSVTIVADVDEAQARAQSQLPDMALLDIDMNVQRGLEYVRWAKALQTEPFPIIVMSHDDETRRLGRTLDVDSWIRMPFDIDDLIDRVNRLCS